MRGAVKGAKCREDGCHEDGHKDGHDPAGMVRSSRDGLRRVDCLNCGHDCMLACCTAGVQGRVHACGHSFWTLLIAGAPPPAESTAHSFVLHTELEP